MEFWIGLIILIVILALPSWSTNQKVEHKDPTNIDNSKMTRDISNGVSQSEIRRRYGNGYYDKNR